MELDNFDSRPGKSVDMLIYYDVEGFRDSRSGSEIVLSP